MFIIIIFCLPAGSGWIIGVGQLCNLFTAELRSDPVGTVGKRNSHGRRDFYFFIPPLLLSILIPLFLSSSVSLFISFLLFPCASLQGTLLISSDPHFHSHTEYGTCHFFDSTTTSAQFEIRCGKVKMLMHYSPVLL